MKRLVLATLGLVVSAVGCMQTTSDEDLAARDFEDWRYQPQENPSGGSTSNHLLPSTYHSNKYKLLNAMSSPLVAQGRAYGGNSADSHVLSSNVYKSGLLDTEQGRGLFQMAVECALPDGQFVTDNGSARTYTGKGLMSTTAGWYSKALTTEQKEDVLRCLIARVNMYGDSVPIVITGQNVTNQQDEDHSGEHWQPEALWDVKITKGNFDGHPFDIISEYAWPLASASTDEASAGCFSVRTSVESRVCAQESANCNFEIRDLAQNECYGYDRISNGESSRYFRCNSNGPAAGRPVVQSWLDPDRIVRTGAGCSPNVAPDNDMNLIPDAP